jgi:hypothetical protein
MKPVKSGEVCEGQGFIAQGPSSQRGLILRTRWASSGLQARPVKRGDLEGEGQGYHRMSVVVQVYPQNMPCRL